MSNTRFTKTHKISNLFNNLVDRSIHFFWVWTFLAILDTCLVNTHNFSGIFSKHENLSFETWNHVMVVSSDIISSRVAVELFDLDAFKNVFRHSWLQLWNCSTSSSICSLFLSLLMYKSTKTRAPSACLPLQEATVSLLPLTSADYFCDTSSDISETVSNLLILHLPQESTTHHVHTRIRVMDVELRANCSNHALRRCPFSFQRHEKRCVSAFNWNRNHGKREEKREKKIASRILGSSQNSEDGLWTETVAENMEAHGHACCLKN